MIRPLLGNRSISERAPLFNPATSDHDAATAGSRLRGSNAASGASFTDGSRLPFSPLLPMPAAPSESDLADSTFGPSDNLTPQLRDDMPSGHTSNNLATRRQARRGISEGYPALRPGHPGLTFTPATQKPLRLDIQAASDLTASMHAPKSAGMIRSYSLPVATQAEFEEQRRIMALGVSPVGRVKTDPSWWQFGWPSPGGVHHPVGFDSRPSTNAPSEERLSSPLSGDAAKVHHSSPSPSRPVSRSSKVHSSCSPKMKSKHLPLPNIQTVSSPIKASAKAHRIPLSMISVNLPASDQQPLDKRDHEVSDREMDALNKRFADWTRVPVKAMGMGVDVEEDYFGLHKDSAPASDTSDEARTPRASSPSNNDMGRSNSGFQPHHHPHRLSTGLSKVNGLTDDSWDTLDFIHPDHLSPLPPVAF